MIPRLLREAHARAGAAFVEIGSAEVVNDYGSALEEHSALTQTAAALDLSFRSRLCLLGADRKPFLHGQVTQQVKELAVGQGCYGAILTAKGRLQSDLWIYCLEDELLLDFEPGLARTLTERLEKYIIAEDAQVVDVAALFGHLSAQGPQATPVVEALGLSGTLPSAPGAFLHAPGSAWGDVYVMCQPRFGTVGYDLFAPVSGLESLWGALTSAARAVGGRPAGWQAMEWARVEAAIPRYGADMDETNLPPEAGLDSRAVHYAKGCYIGQEVIARIRTYGQVSKALRGLRMPPGAQVLPRKGDKIYWGDKEIGYVTSVIASPALKTNVALSYLRREHNQIGDAVSIRVGDTLIPAAVATLPFQPFSPLDPGS
ncbi:MAG: aminomethyl transferase family protein [Verrucomicrobia bacterium]|nr:aminomethyl transferase family protein [Verrucomicrobiota bacterium]